MQWSDLDKREENLWAVPDWRASPASPPPAPPHYRLERRSIKFEPTNMLEGKANECGKSYFLLCKNTDSSFLVFPVIHPSFMSPMVNSQGQSTCTIYRGFSRCITNPVVAITLHSEWWIKHVHLRLPSMFVDNGELLPCFWSDRENHLQFHIWQNVLTHHGAQPEKLSKNLDNIRICLVHVLVDHWNVESRGS